MANAAIAKLTAHTLANGAIAPPCPVTSKFDSCAPEERRGEGARAKKAIKKMSDEHKAALVEGREQGRAVREYLAALSEEKKPGRKVDPATLAQKITQVREEITSEPDSAKRVEHIQKRLDLEAQQADAGGQVDLEALEEDVIAAAKEHSECKGIT